MKNNALKAIFFVNMKYIYTLVVCFKIKIEIIIMIKKVLTNIKFLIVFVVLILKVKLFLSQYNQIVSSMLV
jgi:hypothetical protein